jgi:hypothetical protein
VQIDVREPTARHFLLVVLQDGRVCGSLTDDDIENRMQPRVAGQRAPQLSLMHDKRVRSLPTPIEHAWHEALVPQASRVGGAAPLALCDLELDSFTGHFGGEV